MNYALMMEHPSPASPSDVQPQSAGASSTNSSTRDFGNLASRSREYGSSRSATANSASSAECGRVRPSSAEFGRVRTIELGSSAEFVILRFREFLRTREFGRFPGPTTVRPMQTHARAKNNEATSSASALRDHQQKHKSPTKH